MLNLKDKKLPEAIEVFGQLFFINTSFKVWLDYPERIGSLVDGDFEGYKELFKNKAPVPTQEVINLTDAFFYIPKDVPRKSNGEVVIDYEIDADYIYSAFLQAYGIDLIDTDLHWHKFTALLSSLPESTFFHKIMEYRSYKGKDSELKKLKHIWALPTKLTNEEKKAMEDFNKIFG